MWCAEEIYAAVLYQELMNERLLNWWIQRDIQAEAEKITVQGRKWQINSRESKLNSDQRRQIAVRKGFIEGEDSVYIGKWKRNILLNYPKLKPT